MAEELNGGEYTEAHETGIQINRMDGVQFDVYAIGIPDRVFYDVEREDGTIDLFTYSIMGPEDSTAGRVFLIDVAKRMRWLPPAIRDAYSGQWAHPYVIVLQTIEEEWYSLAEADTLMDARQELMRWMDKIRPGTPFTVPVRTGEQTIWNPKLPGFRTFQLLRALGPYSQILNQN